ncbi:MAG: LPS export ABC transporter ATP-binding protein [Candidatus Margulisiibacteriota bacterium]
MIETQGLVKQYNRRTVVDGISITMNRGEIVGLLGPNGAGKTTTFYMIIGLVRPDSGTVLLDGHDITAMPMYKRARKGLGYLPQESSIFKKLTVEENVFILWEQLKTIPRDEYDARLDSLLGEMNLSHLRKAKGIELSGGERRRVEIVRALATDPAFILLDEPFAGVDPLAVAEIQDIIRALKQKNLGIIITDHNVRETLSITDRAYLIHNGKLLMDGDSKQIAENPLARKFYLGDKFTLE